MRITNYYLEKRQVDPLGKDVGGLHRLKSGVVEFRQIVGKSFQARRSNLTFYLLTLSPTDNKLAPKPSYVLLLDTL